MTRERSEATEAAERALVEAGLDELFVERASATGSPAAAAAPGPRILRPGVALAMTAAAAVLAVVGLFAWRELDRQQEGRRDGAGSDSAAAAADLPPEEEIEIVELDAVGEIGRLDPATRALEVSAPDFDDAALRALVARCPELMVLDLRDAEITDAGLSALRDLPRLEDLGLALCKRLTDGALPVLLELRRLTRLDLTGFVGQTAMMVDGEDAEYVSPFSKFTGAGLGTLGRHPGLRILDLAGTQIDDAGLGALVAGRPPLQALDLSSTPVGPEGLRLLAQLEDLRVLRFLGRAEVKDDLVAIISEIPRLRRLEIGTHGFTEGELKGSGFGALAAAGRLEHLRLENCGRFDAAAGARLAELESLTSLRIDGRRGVDAEALRALGRHPGLRSLGLGGMEMKIDVETIAAIAEGFPALRTLDLPAFPGGAGDARLRAMIAARGGALIVRDRRGRRLPRAFARVVLTPAPGVSTTADLGAATVVLLDANEGRVMAIGERRGHAVDHLDLPELAEPRMKKAYLYETAGLDFGRYRLEVRVPRRPPLRRDLVIDAAGPRLEMVPVEAPGGIGPNWITRNLNLTLGGAGAIRDDAIAFSLELESGLCDGFGDLFVRDCEASDRALQSLHEIRVDEGVILRIYRPGHPVQERALTVPEDRRRLRVDLE